MRRLCLVECALLVFALAALPACGEEEKMASPECCDCMEDTSSICEGGTFSCSAVADFTCGEVCECVEGQDVFWQNRTRA